jgi:copper chaperone CopZ
MSRYLRIVDLLFLVLIALATSSGCQEESAFEPELRSAATNQVTINVTGMYCAVGCAPRARDALATLPWAKNVQVNFDRKQATFVAEIASYDEAAIIAALEKEGFGGTVVK